MCVGACVRACVPYNSSDEAVWEEEVNGDDDSDGGPGFLDPTRRHSLPGM